MRHTFVRLAASFVSTIVFTALVATHSAAAVLYVNAATGANSGPCTVSTTPCKTVTYAMSQAAGGSPGDQIQVAPGSYNTALGETFPIRVKSGVQLNSTSGAESTILDSSGAVQRVLELLNANADTVVEGFTITGGVTPIPPIVCPCPSPTAAFGGGMHVDGGAPAIRRNIFLDNQARGVNFLAGGTEARGGGVFVTAAAPIIENNVFRGNLARGGPGNRTSHFEWPAGPAKGGAIYFEGTGGAIRNNTFHSNSAIGGEFTFGGTGHFGAVYADGASVTNNIIASNAAAGGMSGSVQAAATFGAMQAINPPTPISNNLFFGNTVNGAPSSGDTIGMASVCTGMPPCASVHFLGEPSNLRITPQSPAAGAGTATGSPSDDFAGVTRPNPPSIGAFEPTVADPPRLLNLSARMQVLTGNDVMIGGFVIGGGSNKTVAIVATGPSLAAFGIANPLANPTLTLVRSSDQATLATNDNWQTAGNAAQLQAAGLAPSDALEAAIVVNLPPGAYTAVVQGSDGGTGVSVVAVYEIDGVTNPLINISTRGHVGTGSDVMIGGFIITGSGPQTVAIVATGPSLAAYGIANPLADPTLTLVRSFDQLVLDTNDDWQSSINGSLLKASGFAPSNLLEAGIYATLRPGAYTAIVRGHANTTGVAVISVYKVN